MPFNITIPKAFYLLAIMLVSILSCTKKTSNEILPSASTEKSKDTIFRTAIIDCPCTIPRADGNRIEMTILGKKLCFNRKIRNNAPTYIDQWQTSARNTIYVDYWYNADSTMMMKMEYNNPAFLKHGIPYTFTYATQDSCEVIGIQLYNFHPYQSCRCDLDDGWYVSTFFDPSFEFDVLSFQNNVLEAKFKGDFTTITGKRIYPVTDGYLRIKLEVENNIHY
jgi:hypothetical protein